MIEQIDSAKLELEIADLIAVITIACLGGAVKWARMPYRGRHRALHFFMSLLTAGFVGMLAHFFMSWLDVDLSLQFAVSGAAGYGGGVLLDAVIPVLMKMFYKKAGFEMPEKPECTDENDEDTKA